MQTQIDDINRKLDIVIEEVVAQKQMREASIDLIDDLAIVGKDVFNNTVVQLDKAGVELDPDAMAGAGIRLIRNIGNLNELLDTLESVNDFMKDATPIVRQMGLDAIHKMNQLDQKGYIDFFRELGNVMDNIVTHFNVEDVKALADNVVTILETIKRITQPDMLEAVNNAVKVYKHLDTSDVPEYSLFGAFREMRSPEMRKGLGFMITFLKNLTKEQETKHQEQS
jgi:uncharacterized protein YjgD (DUF1641 family)